MGLKVKAVATREIFHNDNFYIIAFNPITPFPNELKLSKYRNFTCKGELGYISIGKEYEMVIEEKETTKFGTSYEILEVPSMKLDNLTDDGELEILREITTESQAQNVHKAYPNFIRLIIDGREKEIDLKNIYNVGEVRLNAYIRLINEKFKYFYLKQKYKEYQFDISDCKTLYDIFIDENKIDEIINNRPYEVLCHHLRKPFEKADKIIVECRPELENSEQRCEFLIISVLEINELEGSTRLNGENLYYYCKEQYQVPNLLPMLKDVAISSDYIYYDEKSKDLSTMTSYLGECSINTFIKNKLDNSTKLDIDWTKYTEIDGFKMSDTQSNCLKNFCEYNFSLLVGYSGSGKTTSTKGLIALMEDNKITYTLLAPTGKASLRMTEATHRKASTIHRKVLRDGTIDTDVVIVDECSMIDLSTFIMLLNAISNPNCRIVFVGDNAQLMPVGIGCVFNDIINSNKVPMTMLTEVFRYNSSGALYVATNVRQGKAFFNNDDKLIKRTNDGVEIGNNYKFIQTENIFDAIIEQYNKLLDKGVKPKEILCLSPFNVGDIGTYAINNEIQSVVNAPKPKETIAVRNISNKYNVTFRVGDALLNKKNDYKAMPLESWEMLQSDDLLSSDDVPLTTVFNGQDGIIRDIDEKKIVAQFDEELVVFDKIKLSNLLLSYCISVHSSQGSEAKYVINVVSPKHERMLNRNLLYVADTRSKVKQIDIGDMDTYNKALLIDGNKERNTWLKELLLESAE